MQRLSGEAIFLSALLNNQDVASAISFGVTPAHFAGYTAEFNWLLNYITTYGTEPTKDAFAHAFPDFQFSEHEDIRSAADMVFKAYGKRQLTEAMTSAVDLMGMGDLQEAYATLVKAEPKRTAPKPRRLLVDQDFLSSWDDPQYGVEVPYPTLQRYTGGIRPGNIWYLAARPGQGKTAHLCNIALHAVLAGNKVMFYSLEMSEMEVRFRFHAALATHYGYRGIDLNGLRDRRVTMHEYKTFVSELDDRLNATGGSLEIHTPRDGAVSPGVVAANAENYHLNVIDYIGLMKSDGGNAAIEDWRVASQISNTLKEIALSSGSAILAASQINREGETGATPPKIKNLAQSDALGQDADVVLTMRAKAHNVATHFSLEKNRHGSSGIPFYTTFDPNRGVYSEISGETADELATIAEAAHV